MEKDKKVWVKVFHTKEEYEEEIKKELANLDGRRFRTFLEEEYYEKMQAVDNFTLKHRKPHYSEGKVSVIERTETFYFLELKTMVDMDIFLRKLKDLGK